MHVCMLLAGRFPPNRRVKAEATALREAGHAVTVCCRGGRGDTERDIVDGIDVRRLPDETLYAGVRGKLDGVRYALQLVHPAWLRLVDDVDDERPVDVCCVRDLSLLKTALRVGNGRDIPVVADLPGNAPAVIEHERDHRDGGRLRALARRAFHSSWRLGRLETGALRDVDHLVTTCEEARARYVRERDIDPARVTVVRDTVDPTLASTTERDHRARGLGFDPDEAFVVTAFGDLAPDRELDTLVEAAARAADSVVDLRLVLVGPDRGYMDDLAGIARRKLAGGRVTFRTDVDPDRLPEYVAVSDACVFPDPEGPTTATDVASELFRALAFGVPVVVTADVAPHRRIVERTNAGRVVPSGDVGTLTDALVTLADPSVATELGANARAAADHRYDWERDAARLRSLYAVLNDPESRFDNAMRYDPIS